MDEREFLTSQLENVNDKLDAIHLSQKEALTELKVKIDGMQSEFGRHDREIASVRGGIKAIAVGLPAVTAILVWALTTAIN